MRTLQEKPKVRNGILVGRNPEGFDEVLGTVSLRKGDRTLALKSSVIEHNGVLYDANEISMDRKNRITSLANFKFIKALWENRTMFDPAIADVIDTMYKSIFKDITVPWVGADDVTHNVQIESIAEALDKSMTNMGVLWEKYKKK